MSLLLTEKEYEQISTSVNIKGKKLFLITAPTGSGKTTGIPIVIFRDKMKILVSLPTKTSAENASRYVSRKYFQYKVDYMTRMHHSNIKDNDIIYAVSGSVVNRLYDIIDELSKSKAKNVGIDNLVLIVDEVHTGSVNNSLIICLWRELYDIYTRYGVQSLIPKLILITANNVKFPYLENIFEISAGRPDNPPERLYLNPALKNYKLYDAIVEQFLIIIRNETDNKNKHSLSRLLVNREYESRYPSAISRNTFIKGHILIFVPGKSEVSLVKRLIAAKIESEKLIGIKLYGAHGDMSGDELDKVYEDVGTNIIKVVVATNIAESSVTIPGIMFIIDSMKERRPTGTGLEERFITKNSSIQRMGRAGRTIKAKSYYYAMITETDYNKLEDNRVPEIESVPIYTEMITMYVHGLSPMKLLEGIVSDDRIEEMIQILCQMGMITQNTVSDKKIITKVTLKGEFAGKNRQGARASSFVWEWIQRYGTKDIYTCLLTSCIIDMNLSSLINYPTNIDRGKYNREKFKRVMGPDTFTTIINMWNEVIVEFPGLIYGRHVGRKRSKIGVQISVYRLKLF